MPDLTKNKIRHNRKKYKQILYRVAKGSELEKAITEQTQNGVSVNYLISCLLAGHYGVDIPQRSYHRRETRSVM